MDATKFFSITNQASPLAGDSVSSSTSAKTSARGTDFADVFHVQMQSQVRQESAAPIGSPVKLHVVQLGPKINLITANAPLPDMQSLVCFAKSQGLDEEAVKTLFGKQSTDKDISAADLTQVFSIVDASALAQSLTIKGVDLKPAAAVGAAITAGINFLTAPALAAQDLTVNAGELDAKLTKVNAASIISMQVSQMLQSNKPQMTSEVLGNETMSGNDIVSDSLRVRLDYSAEVLTKKLAFMSGTTQKANWGSLLNGAEKDSLTKNASIIPQENLRLDVPASLLLGLNEESKSEVTDQDSGAGVQTGPLSGVTVSNTTSEQEKTSAAAADQKAHVDQRGVQFQQAADRLGQAVAQRLLAQIERGEWKLQLRLQPASLGRIDVALEMHTGGLDAVFTSDNTLTRELIAQGSAKLRDSLNQSGTAVASVIVNSDQGGKSDGNPTPGRPFKGRGGALKNDDAVNSVESKEIKISPKVDGLDILA